MDKIVAVNPKKATKHPLKPRKKIPPVKVVYISNPMKVQTSASQFRALVQQLTGRDADTRLDRTYCATDRVGGLGRDHHQELIVPHAVDQVKEEEHALVEDEVPTTQVQSSSELGNGLDLSFDEAFEDDVFMLPMLGNFPDFLPSNFWYESTHIGPDEV